MKTSSLSSDRLQLISQILGMGRGQYVDPLAQLPRRTRSVASTAGKLLVPPSTPAKQRVKATR